MRENELTILGKNIKRKRISEGLKQSDLAQMAKTRSATISLIENCNNPNPRWKTIEQIAYALKSDIHTLTIPEVSEQSKNDLQLPAGLNTLMQNQKSMMALNEPRINLKELDWLSKLPIVEFQDVSPEKFLLILRHFRLTCSQI